jgi:UDP-N-acetylglucosamine/UDP-N-acetylgalactosamine diphosphorylase
MQDNLPAVDKEGKIVLSTKSELFLAPNGNGGLYVGLQKNRILEQMKANGAKYVHIVGVDNVLNKLADPVMVGYMTKNHFEVVSKYVDKINAKESVGVHILKNGKPSIIEYSEMSEELRNEKILETLKYKEGFIAAFMTTTSFLEKVAQSFSSSEDISQYHLAQKKIPFFDLKSGQKITPEKNNGYKFELFIFDIFPIASSFGLMEVIRDQEFAPVKNKPGDETDTPITAKNLTSKLHIKWL